MFGKNLLGFCNIFLVICVCVCVCQSFNCMQLFATPWTISHQAPLPMEFSRQEYWSELPFPSPGCLPNPGIEPRSPALWADSLPSDIFLGNHFLKCINLIFDMKSESEVAQSCPTLCDPVDCSPPGFSIHGIFQA